MTIERDKQNGTERAANEALDQTLQQLPEDITSALAAARQKAIASAADESSVKTTATIYQFDRPKMMWSGAIAASVTALALTLSLQQPGVDLPVNNADDLLSFTEIGVLDETEWELVQDLEFALWLSQLSDDALTTDPQG
jgi:hypothetical protein